MEKPYFASHEHWDLARLNSYAKNARELLHKDEGYWGTQMLSTVLFGLAALCAVLVVYPYLLYPAVLRFLPKKPIQIADAPTPEGDAPYISVLICAYNEEAVLDETLRNLQAIHAEFPYFEVLAYSDASTDATNAIIESYPELVRPFLGQTRKGKTFGMSWMAEHAKGEVLAFCDANVRVAEGAMEGLARYFSDPEIGCVAGKVIYVNEGDSSTSFVNSAYWRLEETIKRLESETGSAMGATGSLFAVRRRLYPEIPPDIIDDMYVSFTALLEGYRIVSGPDFIAYEKAAAESNEEFKRKVRISCQAFNCHRLLAPRLRKVGRVDQFKYWSHKYIRWYGVFFLAAGALFAGLGVLFSPWPLTLSALALVGLIAAALMELVGVRTISRFSAIFGALLATGMGRLQSLQGLRYQTWDPTARQ